MIFRSEAKKAQERAITVWVPYSFSSVARDVLAGFTDPEIDRVTRIVDN